MIKIHIPVPTNPSKFYEGELREKFELNWLLKARAESDRNPITALYFRTAEGLYRIEKGDNGLYLYFPDKPRQLLTPDQIQGCMLELNASFTYEDGLETSPLSEIATIRRVLQLTRSRLNPASSLYKL